MLSSVAKISKVTLTKWSSSAAKVIGSWQEQELEPRCKSRAMTVRFPHTYPMITLVCRKGLTEEGFDIGCSVSAIFPIMVRDNRKVYEIARELQKRCIFVIGSTYPAVRTKEARLRVSVLASQEIEQLEQFVTALLEIRKSIPF